jgi:hypothetical protein
MAISAPDEGENKRACRVGRSIGSEIIEEFVRLGKEQPGMGLLGFLLWPQPFLAAAVTVIRYRMIWKGLQCLP